MAIVHVVNKILGAIENKKLSNWTFLGDLSKAFDTVNHDILIRKLDQYDIRGIALGWYTNYLCNKKQFVPSFPWIKLFLLQKRAVRIISKAGYLDHTTPLFTNLNLLN